MVAYCQCCGSMTSSEVHAQNGSLCDPCYDMIAGKHCTVCNDKMGQDEKGSICHTCKAMAMADALFAMYGL